MSDRSSCQYELDSITLRERLDAVLGSAHMPSGTMSAHTLHDLFEAEARQQGGDAAKEAWMAVDAEAIGTFARSVESLVWGDRTTAPWTRRTDLILPAGTVAMECMTGCIFVGAETLGFDVDRPGLHAIRELPSHPGGSNLQLLLSSVHDLSRDLPCSTLGPPTLVVRYQGQHLSHRLQFPPFAAAGGVVLQRQLDFCSWGELFCAFPADRVASLAKSVVKDMTNLWLHGPRIVGRVEAAKQAANLVASEIEDGRWHAVTVDLSRQFSLDRLAIGVEFDVWEHTFRRGLLVQELGPDADPAAALKPANLDFTDAVAEVRAVGADGWIGGLARAIVVAAPAGPAKVLADLGQQYETYVTLPTQGDPLDLRLFWSHGEILAETVWGHFIKVSVEGVTLQGETLPETLVNSLHGRPLHAALDGVFRCDSPIAHIANNHGKLEIKVESDRWLVNCHSSTMWAR